MFFIFLGQSFKFQEVIIATIIRSRKFPAGRRPRMINRAAPRLSVKELANLAKMRVSLPPHDTLVTMGGFEIFLLGFFQWQFKMLGNSRRIPVLHLNHRIGTTITRTFQTIILLARHARTHFQTARTDSPPALKRNICRSWADAQGVDVFLNRLLAENGACSIHATTAPPLRRAIACSRKNLIRRVALPSPNFVGEGRWRREDKWSVTVTHRNPCHRNPVRRNHIRNLPICEGI